MYGEEKTTMEDKISMKMRNGILASGALAVLTAFGLLAGVAGAQNSTPTQGLTTDDPSPHPVQIAGKVDKVDAAARTLTMTTRKGSVTVNVSDTTWILVAKEGQCSEGTLSDIQASQPAVVGGMTTTTANQVNARTIVQGRCLAAKAGRVHEKRGGAGRNGPIEGLAQFAAAGTIKAISGNTITLTTERGVDVTVTTTADTAVLNGGFKDASSLKVGDEVQVLGKPAKSTERPATPPTQKPARSIEAWGIRVVTDASKVAAGRVEKIDGNIVTLKTRQGTLTVTLDSGTGYKAANLMDRKVALSNAVQADVKVGGILLIEGVAGQDGKSMTADAVIIVPAVKAQRPLQ